MNTSKIYKDIDGNDRTIYQMVRYEPEWAASRIQVGEEALEIVRLIKKWDVDNCMREGEFFLPLSIRKAIQDMKL